MDASEALTTAIGEFCVDTVGQDKLTGLEVTFDPRESSAFITMSLRDNSDAAQREAINHMFEVERVFNDDASLTYIFVRHIEAETEEAQTRALRFSFA